jgi:hypothetical protein
MNSIYTSKDTLVVEETIWSGVIKFVKHSDGTYARFYRTNDQTEFKKTGWGEKAKKDFFSALTRVKTELSA